uniref:Uncharacterized protein n=1 Tax=Anguilla anguilla TaxID=7936 RepID=A0A0E9X482_ANGAN
MYYTVCVKRWLPVLQTFPHLIIIIFSFMCLLSTGRLRTLNSRSSADECRSVSHACVHPCLHCDGLNTGLIQHSGVCSGLRQRVKYRSVNPGKNFFCSECHRRTARTGFCSSE